MGMIAGVVVLGIATMLQTAIFSRLIILNGAVDVILLILLAWALQKHVKTRDVIFWTIFGAGFIAFISAVPSLITIMIYIVLVVTVRWVHSHIWQGVLLVYIFSVLLGTLFQQVVTYGVLRFLNGTSLPVETTLIHVVLPSLILNLLFAFPIYLLMKDLADWIYPAEVDAYV